jgi:geranylgeranyl reductase family protein
VVIGAGPAGCAAALTLSRAGAAVTVIDKATFPRDKICGDGLTAGALRELESLGLNPEAVPSWTPVNDVFVRSPSGRTVCFPLPRDGGAHAVVARRVDLDAAVLAHTRAAGVEVREGCGIDGLVRHTDRVELTTSDGGTVEATHVIAADGMWSPTRKLAGDTLPGYRGDWHAFRQYFTGVTGPGSQHLWVSFEPDILPGYFWSFPLGDGRVNVGFGIMRHDGVAPGNKLSHVRDMAQRWPELLERSHINEVLGPDATPESPHRAWPIPTRVDGLSLARDRVLYVGDAAAAGDPMTGEGIGQALLTGRLAAEAVLAAPDNAAAAYRDSARAALVADHRMALLLGRALSHRKGARFAVALAGATPWTRRNFARWLFEDYPRALVATPRRWRRGMFTPPGAYTTNPATQPEGETSDDRSDGDSGSAVASNS